MSVVHLYETTGDAWKSNIGPSINKIPSTAFVAQRDKAGDLVVTNQADQDMAGGLVSENLPVPPGCSHFGLDILLSIDPEDLLELARCENDLKITFPDTPTIKGPQANLSLQWNDDKKMWQLDPTGSTWVDSGFSKPIQVGLNEIQSRVFFDGSKWTVEGLRINGSDPFIPSTQFQNIPAIASGWGPGLHPQLQTEARKAPWFLRETFQRVRVLASDSPIPYSFD